MPWNFGIWSKTALPAQSWWICLFVVVIINSNNTHIPRLSLKLITQPCINHPSHDLNVIRCTLISANLFIKERLNDTLSGVGCGHFFLGSMSILIEITHNTWCSPKGLASSFFYHQSIPCVADTGPVESSRGMNPPPSILTMAHSYMAAAERKWLETCKWPWLGDISWFVPLHRQQDTDRPTMFSRFTLFARLLVKNGENIFVPLSRGSNNSGGGRGT